MYYDYALLECNAVLSGGDTMTLEESETFIFRVCLGWNTAYTQA
jgi:hypothetical protein